MKCPSSKRQLLASIGRLADDEAGEIAQHARTCLPCLRRAREHAQLLTSLAAPPSYACTESELTTRIMDACIGDGETGRQQHSSNIEQHAPAPKRRMRYAAASFALMAAASALLALLGASAGTTLEWTAAADMPAAQREQVARARVARSIQVAPAPIYVAAELERRALSHVARAQYDQAESLYERSIAIKEQVLGVDAAAVADSLDELAALYLRQHRYVQAEPLWQRSVAIKTKRLGPDHPAVMSALDSLKVLLSLTTQA